MEKGYFVVRLMDGTRLDFNKQCNEIKYADSKLCIFLHIFEDGAYETLGSVPYANIKYIRKAT